MEQKDLPIGFIDSGFGGLTVLKQSLKQLPNESVIYLGDNARCPYGPRPAEEVKDYIWQLTKFLLKKGIKMLVIACNTGTAAALEDLREQLDIPVVGVIHAGSRAAIKRTSNNRIGIIGTQGTINSHLYERVMQDKKAELMVYSTPCPEFVSLVEQQQLNTPETWRIVRESLSQFDQTAIDTLILGCTHYPLLSPIIQAVMGNDVTLVDSGVETINEVSTLLDYFGISRTAEEAQAISPTQQFYTTGELAGFTTFVHHWIGSDYHDIRTCQIEGDEINEISNRHSK